MLWYVSGLWPFTTNKQPTNLYYRYFHYPLFLRSSSPVQAKSLLVSRTIHITDCSNSTNRANFADSRTHELVSDFFHTADADKTIQFCLVRVGGVNKPLRSAFLSYDVVYSLQNFLYVLVSCWRVVSFFAPTIFACSNVLGPLERF